MEIEQKHSNALNERLKSAISKEPSILKETLKDLIHDLHRQKLDLNSVIDILEAKPSLTWMKEISKSLHSEEERGIKTLIKLMQLDDNKDLLEMCHDMMLVVMTKRPNAIKQVMNSAVDSGGAGCARASPEFGGSEKGQDLKRDLKQKETKLCEKIAEIDQAIFEIYGFNLRSTQLMSVLIFLHCDEKFAGNLQQISTGEGKSLIIVTLAILKALQGNHIDIITSSSVLAKRDAEAYKQLHEKFGLKVGHNCSENVDERRIAYTDCHVVYGEISSFQRDYLVDGFYGEDNGFGARQRHCVIVDEVDNMLLDKGENTLYLSHIIPGMDSLEPLLVLIWKFVHGQDITGSDEDIIRLSEAARSAMYPLLCLNDIPIVWKSTSLTLNSQLIWDELLHMGVIDEKGKILKVDDIKNNKNVFEISAGELVLRIHIIEYKYDNLQYNSLVHWDK
jgi:hypothetical protein